MGAKEFGLEKISKMLMEGWDIIGQINDGNPLVVGEDIIYHLVKFSKEDIDTVEGQNKQNEILSMISVPINDIDQKLAEGYTIMEDKVYAKNAILIKRGTKPEQVQAPEEPVMEALVATAETETPVEEHPKFLTPSH